LTAFATVCFSRCFSRCCSNQASSATGCGTGPCLARVPRLEEDVTPRATRRALQPCRAVSIGFALGVPRALAEVAAVAFDALRLDRILMRVIYGRRRCTSQVVARSSSRCGLEISGGRERIDPGLKDGLVECYPRLWDTAGDVSPTRCLRERERGPRSARRPLSGEPGRSRSGRMMCPKEMVPLQIDLAIELRRYRFSPAAKPTCSAPGRPSDT
jgi:hypothetical protein